MLRSKVACLKLWLTWAKKTMRSQFFLNQISFISPQHHREAIHLSPSHVMGILSSDTFPLLVVLNPHSGKKQGIHVWETIVQPALNHAQKPFRLIESTSQGHVQSYFNDNIKPILTDLVQSLSIVNDPSTPSSTVTRPSAVTLQVMVLGGDGSVHEIVNGILQGVAGTEFVSNQFRPKIEFAVIPTGTGNAISTSIGVTSVQDAVDRFLAGKVTPLRLMTVSTRTKIDQSSTFAAKWDTRLYTVVVNSFGLHCATVYDAEEFRHLGNERFRQAAMKCRKPEAIRGSVGVAWTRSDVRSIIEITGLG
ncbi:unnamed protein product [Mortierella alpina]